MMDIEYHMSEECSGTAAEFQNAAPVYNSFARFYHWMLHIPLWTYRLGECGPEVLALPPGSEAITPTAAKHLSD
ncbi:hypothetical protein CYMTET_54194 [Cymbomonas tetramitiformis]|uniref:Uncharacterized protein n=1 Tax=Cymbomonas tetramitiformis TaxID=36881 RepID=A0AAE0BGK9_9CHLO|nr:hypothetical protein CYMTET_54194 [Cymbomonas tetramitiformis]